MKFKSGVLALFDTKTKKSDTEAPNKHNGLIAYCEREYSNLPERKLMGSIILPDETARIKTWRYSQTPISNTSDLTGWEYFIAGLIV